MTAGDPLDRLPAAIVAFDDGGVVRAANAELHAALEHAPGTLCGTPFDAILQPAARIFVQTHLRPLLLLQGVVREFHLVLRTRGGAARPVIGNAVRTGSLTECVFLALERRHEFEARLLAARRAAEEALEARNALLETEAARRIELETLLTDLRALLSRLDAEHASASRAVARSLHEQVAQDIAALKLGLDMLRLAAAPDALQAQLESLGSVAGRSLAQVRSLSYDLYPPQLELGTLVTALRPAIAAFEARTGLSVEFSAPSPVPAVDLDGRRVLYRLVEDALASLTGTTTRVAVRVSAGPEVRLELTVAPGASLTEDFDVARARLASLGGSLQTEVLGDDARVVIASLPQTAGLPPSSSTAAP